MEPSGASNPQFYLNLSHDSYIQKLGNPGFWGGKLALEIFRGRYPTIDILVFKSSQWFTAFGTEIDIKSYLQAQPESLLIRENEKGDYFDVCDAKGVPFYNIQIQKDGNSLFDAIVQSAKVHRIEFDSSVQEHIQLRNVLTKHLKDSGDDYKNAIAQQLKTLQKHFNDRWEKDTYLFDLADDDVLINTEMLVSLLCYHLNVFLEKEIASDFGKLIDQLYKEKEIKFCHFKILVEQYAELSNLIHNFFKPYNFYRNVSNISKMRHELEQEESKTQFRERVKNKSVVLFVGKSGAGKSSTIDALLNCEGILKNKGDTMFPEYYIDFGDNPPAKVSHVRGSCTSFPEIYKNVSHEELVYCDTVGIEETREGFHAMKNHILLSSILKEAAGICIVFVLEHGEFKTRINFKTYHDYILGLLGTDYLKFKKGCLILMNKGSARSLDNFLKELDLELKNQNDPPNQETKEFSKFMDGIFHGWYPCHGFGTEPNVPAIRDLIGELSLLKNVKIPIVSHDAKAIDSFYIQLRKQILLSFTKLFDPINGIISNEKYKNSPLEGLHLEIFKTLKDIQKFVEQLSTLIKKRVSFVEFINTTLESIKQCGRMMKLEKHLNKMIDFVQILDSVTSDDAKEKSSDLEKYQDDLNAGLKDLVIKFMTFVRHDFTNAINRYCEDMDQKLKETRTQSTINKEKIQKIKQQHSQNIHLLYAVKILKFLNEAADQFIQFDVKDLFNLAKSHFDNNTANVKTKISIYEGDYSDEQIKMLFRQAQERQNMYREQAEKSFQDKKYSWIVQQIITVIRAASSPVLKELVERYGETAIAKLIASKMGMAQLSKLVPFLGFGFGAVQAFSNFLAGNYRASFLNFVSGSFSFLPVYGTAASITIDVINIAMDCKDFLDHQHKLGRVDALISYLETIQIIDTYERLLLEESKQQGQVSIKDRKRKHICAVDGGGMLAVVSARILAHIEKELKTNSLWNYFDLFAGTSAGSILVSALSLNTGSGNNIKKNRYKALDTIRLFQNEKRRIFANPQSNKLQSRYSNEGLCKVLKDHLQDTKLNEVLVPLLITATKEIERIPSTFDFVHDDKQPTYLLRDAVLASVSAPTYFPRVNMDFGQGNATFYDGGLAANNPSARAFEHMVHKHKLEAKDIILLSIGTGDQPATKIGSFNEEGQIDWALNGVRRLIKHNENDCHNRMVQTFEGCPDQYFRFQPTFKENFEMDDISEETMIKLLEETERYLELPETSARIKKLVQKLQED